MAKVGKQNKEIGKIIDTSKIVSELQSDIKDMFNSVSVSDLIKKEDLDKITQRFEKIEEAIKHLSKQKLNVSTFEDYRKEIEACQKAASEFFETIKKGSSSDVNQKFKDAISSLEAFKVPEYETPDFSIPTDEIKKEAETTKEEISKVTEKVKKEVSEVEKFQKALEKAQRALTQAENDKKVGLANIEKIKSYNPNIQAESMKNLVDELSGLSAGSADYNKKLKLLQNIWAGSNVFARDKVLAEYDLSDIIDQLFGEEGYKKKLDNDVKKAKKNITKAKKELKEATKKADSTSEPTVAEQITEESKKTSEKETAKVKAEVEPEVTEDFEEKVQEEVDKKKATVKVSTEEADDSKKKNKKSEKAQENKTDDSKGEESDEKDSTGKAKLEPELSETFKEDAEKLIDELGLEAKVTLSPVLPDDYSDKVADLVKESKDKNSTSADESTVEVESGENPQDKSNTTIELKPELIETFKTDAESAVAQLDIESPITLYPHVSDDFESDAMNSMPDLALSVELTSKENSNEEDKSEDSFKQVELTPKLSGTFSDDAKQLVDELSPQADITLNPSLTGDFTDRAQDKVNDYGVGVYVDIYPRVNEGFNADAQASADKVLTSEATTKSEQDTNTAQLTPKLSDNFKQVATDKINDLGIEGNAILVPVIPSNFNTLATNRVEATKPSAPIDIYPNLSADFESNINNAIDKLNLSGEESSFAKIGNSINDIIELVKQKNALIENEEEIVSRASTSEYKDFRAIADSISSVVFYLEELDKLMSNLDKLQGLTDKLKSIKFTKATSGNIENFATELEKLGDKLKDFGEKTKSIDLSHIDTISSNLNSLPSGKTFSKNLHELGDALSEFGKVLEDFNLNGGKSSPIITQISDLLSHSRELENLAKILNNYKKIKNVSSAVNGTDTLDDLYKQKSSKIKAISSLESKKQYNNLDRNSRIDEEIAYYENEIYDLDKKITNTVGGSQKLAAYNDEKKKELSYLEEELRLKRDLTAIDKRQRQSERSISDSKAEVDSYYNQITEKLKLIKSTMSKKKSTSGDDEIIDKFNSELDNRIEQYGKELETLKKEFSSKIESDTDWADLSSYISEKQKAIQLLEEEISLYKERKARIQESAEARRDDNAMLEASAVYYKKIESFQDFYQKKTSKKSFSLMSSDELDILKKYKSILDKIAEYRTKGWEDGSSWKDDILTDTQMSNLDYAISRMKDLKAQYESLSVYEKGTGDTKIEKFLNKVYTFMGNNTKAAKLFRTELESLIGTAKAAGKDVNLDNLMDQFLKIENAASSSGLMGNSFLDDFKKQANYTLSNFLAQYLSIQDVIRYAQSAISTIEDLDYALLDLSKTAAMTESQLNDFYFSANDSAKALGVTTEEIIDLASSWSRLGYNTNEEATKMAEMTAKFAAISPGTSTDEAQTG